MLRNLAWREIDALTRSQLTMFQVLCDQINLTSDDRCRALNLNGCTWAAWAAFLGDAPLPAEPALPDMLRRLARAAFHLSCVTYQIDRSMRLTYPPPAAGG